MASNQPVLVEKLSNLWSAMTTEPEIDVKVFRSGSATLYPTFIIYKADIDRIDFILMRRKRIELRMGRHFSTAAEASKEFNELEDNADFLIWAEMPNGIILERQMYANGSWGSRTATLIQDANGYKVTDMRWSRSHGSCPETETFAFSDETRAREKLQAIYDTEAQYN